MPDNAVFAAIADPSRRAILERLNERPHAVHELAARLPISRSAVSQHLKLLRDAGLVTESRQGKFVFYRARLSGLGELADWLTRLGAAASKTPHGAAVAPDDFARRMETVAEEEWLDAELERWEETWPDTDPLNSAVRAWIRGASQVLEKSSIALGNRFDINLTDISILGILHRIGPPHESTPTNLSRISLTSLPGMTRRLDHLEQRGLITRLPGTDDRRSRVVRLGEKGSALLRDYVQQQRAEPLDTAFNLPQGELRLLARSLRRLLLRMQKIAR